MSDISKHLLSRSLDMPKLTIGMPVYNSEKFIHNALESLLSQTFNDFELIISDNASTDSTAIICQEYARRDKRIRYIRQSKNMGPIWNFNFVLQEAKCKYFMWSADDDYWHPTFIEKNIRILESDETIVGSISDIELYRKFTDELKPDITDPLNRNIKKFQYVHPTSGSFEKRVKFYLRFFQASIIYGIYRTEKMKESFSKLYDSLQTHSIIQKMGISENILKIAAKLLEKSDEPFSWINLSNTPPLFRMDEPKKNTNLVEWHQERVSYEQNEDGSNGLIVWIPLQNVDKKIGTLDVCVGSHKEGFIEPTDSGTYGNIQSTKKFVSDNITKKFKQLSVEMKMGDALFVSMLTIHKSGNMDNANKFRLTLTTRIHNTYSNDFSPGRIRFIKSIYT